MTLSGVIKTIEEAARVRAQFNVSETSPKSLPCAQVHPVPIWAPAVCQALFWVLREWRQDSPRETGQTRRHIKPSTVIVTEGHSTLVQSSDIKAEAWDRTRRWSNNGSVPGRLWAQDLNLNSLQFDSQMMFLSSLGLLGLVYFTFSQCWTNIFKRTIFFP